MPLPIPTKGQSKEDFISNFMSNKNAKKEFPEQKQRLVVANQKWRDSQKSKTKEHVCLQGLKIKDSEPESDNEYVVEGLFATTHPDKTGEILSVQALTQMVDIINDTSCTTSGTKGAARSVSLFHDWIKEKNPSLDEAAFILPPVKLVSLPNGHTGIEGAVRVNEYYQGKMTPAEILYRVKHGGIAGFSIEYDSKDDKIVDVNGQTYNYITDVTEFGGIGFARARKIGNPYAVAYKEIEDSIKEAKNMTEEIKVEDVIAKLKEDSSFTDSIVAQLKKKEDEESSTPDEDESKPDPKEGDGNGETKPDEGEVKAKEFDVNEIVKKIKETESFQTAVGQALKVKQKPLNTGLSDDEVGTMKIKEMQDALKDNDVLRFKEFAGQHIDEHDLLRKELRNPQNYTAEGFRHTLKVKCDGKGLRIMGGLKMKGTLDSSSNTSSYTQSPVEFADLFTPGLVDTFNNRHDLFGFLRKKTHPTGNGMYYQWKMITNRNPDSNDTFVHRDDVTVLKNYADKSNYQTPIKIARRGISVTDFINRYSAASLGDLFLAECETQMNEMMVDVDEALFDEVADGTGNAPLGLEAVADSAGNTTLYGYTRSTANRLAPTAAGNTYTAVGGSLTEAVIRTKLSYIETEGTRKGDIAIITSPIGRDYLFNLLDGNRRFNKTDAIFGFNRFEVPTYDGIPIIVDPFCTSTADANAAMYIIDVTTDLIVIAMEPRLVGLAKVGAATEAYLQFDFAHVYEQPRRIGMLDTLTGP